MNKFFEKHIPNPILRELAEWVLTLAMAVVLYFLLQQFLFKSARVMGISMEPTFQHSERLIILRASYWFGEPEYGDVVAFPFKGDTKQKFIKRIVGRPGDIINLENNYFTVNSVPLDSMGIVTSLGNVSFPLTVPQGCYFVLGDNINASKDSRYQEVGCIPKADIIGKAVLRYWPFDKFEIIKT